MEKVVFGIDAPRETKMNLEFSERTADEVLASLSMEDKARPGMSLLMLLLLQAKLIGASVHELAEKHLGIPELIFNDFLNGKKPIPQLDEEVIVKAAAFLGVPKVSVMFEAGQLSTDDLFPPR